MAEWQGGAKMKYALIVVDIQNDFCPDGALAVPEGDQVIPVANQLIERFEEHHLPVFLTRDWHPPNHCSFQEFGGPWPVHCVAGTPGAAFHPDLRIPKNAPIISKATRPDRENYSDFEASGLADRLNAQDVDNIIIVGLATDYCVKANVLDGLAAGFEITVIPEGIRAVNVNPSDGPKAIEEMRHCGARFLSLQQVLSKI